MDKDKIQLEIERIARQCSDCVRFITEDVLKKQEEAKKKSIENAKQYAYECAEENKYGAYRYINF